ncbi:hypothetical protein ACOMHN_025889 [Nucella lapillus]
MVEQRLPTEKTSMGQHGRHVNRLTTQKPPTNVIVCSSNRHSELLRGNQERAAIAQGCQCSAVLCSRNARRSLATSRH